MVLIPSEKMKLERVCVKKKSLIFAVGLLLGAAGWHGLGAMEPSGSSSSSKTISVFRGDGKWHEVQATEDVASSSSDLKILIFSDGSIVKVGAKNALHKAAIKNDGAAITKILAWPDIDINAQDIPWKKTALHYAAEHGHRDAVIALLDARADKNSTDLSDMTPADWARNENHNELAVFIDTYVPAVPGHLPAPRRPHLCTIQ